MELKLNKKTVTIGAIAGVVLIALLFGGSLVGYGIQKYKYYSNFRGSDKVTGDVKKNFEYSNNSGNRDIGGLDIGNYTITTKFGIKYSFHTEDLGGNFEGDGKTILLAYDGSKLPQGRIVRDDTEGQQTEQESAK